MKLALKIDVATARGTREGVPQLAALLERHDARASFLFTLGTHHLLGCPWLPGTDLGRRFAALMRSISAAGFECGIHAFDRARWLSQAVHANEAWTRRAMESAQSRYLDIFGEPARIHGAPGWQMNVHAYRLTQRLEFQFSSDTRGSHPFLPVLNAEIVTCPQLPTTLPTLQELLATPGISPDNVAQRLLQLCSNPLSTGHVYTLRAEHEGLHLRSVFAQLLSGWRKLGYQIITLGDYGRGLDMNVLPYHNVVQARIPGLHGTVAAQGAEFLA